MPVPDSYCPYSCQHRNERKYRHYVTNADVELGWRCDHENRDDSEQWHKRWPVGASAPPIRNQQYRAEHGENKYREWRLHHDCDRVEIPPAPLFDSAKHIGTRVHVVDVAQPAQA